MSAPRFGVGLLALLMLAAGPRPVVAQADTIRWQGESRREARSLCFRGGPLAECRSFLLTEWGGGLYMAGEGDIPMRWNVGLMVNRTDRTAAGISMLVRASDVFSSRETEWAYGVEARLRRYYLRGLSVEAGAGFAVTGSGVGPVFEGAVNAFDLFAITLAADAVPIYGNWHEQLRLGVRFGSWLGLPMGTVTGLAFLFIPYT